MVEDSKSGETEDNEVREEIKEEVHELQDHESEESEEEDRDPEEQGIKFLNVNIQTKLPDSMTKQSALSRHLWLDIPEMSPPEHYRF